MFVLCVGKGPCDGLIPHTRSSAVYIRIKELKSGQGPTKGCKAIDRCGNDTVADNFRQ
jgi:hypothetical protein